MIISSKTRPAQLLLPLHEEVRGLIALPVFGAKPAVGSAKFPPFKHQGSSVVVVVVVRSGLISDGVSVGRTVASEPGSRPTVTKQKHLRKRQFTADGNEKQGRY